MNAEEKNLKAKTELERYFKVLPGLIERSKKNCECLRMAGAPSDISSLDYSKPVVSNGCKSDAEIDCSLFVTEIEILNTAQIEYDMTDRAIKSIDSEAQAILRSKYGTNDTIETIAEKYSVSVGTIHNKVKSSIYKYISARFG